MALPGALRALLDALEAEQARRRAASSQAAEDNLEQLLVIVDQMHERLTHISARRGAPS
jgi:hypothetical protein